MLESIRELIKPYLCEFIGTFCFLSVISWTIWGTHLTAAGNGPFVGFYIGSALMVVVYFGGSISGGHFNPAVSLAIFLTGSTIFKARDHVAFGPIQLIGYWVAQLCGAFLAGGISYAFSYEQYYWQGTPGDKTGLCMISAGYPARFPGMYPGGSSAGTDSAGCSIINPTANGPVGWGTAAVVEMFGTMALVLTVLNVATVSTGAANAGNSTFGLAIGGVITAWAYGGGWISGGAFNPAVGMLPLVWGQTADVGIYWFGPMMGSLCGVIFFMLTNPGEFMEGEITPMITTVKDCINEFIGTALFCGLISLCVGGGAAAAPVAIGTMLMCMVYMGGHVSGGHFNPAVSLAVWIRGKAPWWKCLLYVLSQSVGALIAGGISNLVFKDVNSDGMPFGIRNYGMPAFGMQMNVAGAEYNTQYPFGTAWVVELFGTCILASSVLMSATTDNKNQNNGYYGLAIGFSVTVSAASFGYISGGAFNPAVGLLPLASPNDWKSGDGVRIKQDRWKYVLCYWTGPFFGAALAAFFFWVLNPDEGYFMHPEKVMLVGEHGSVELAQGEADVADSADFATSGDNEDPTLTEEIPSMGDDAVQGSI
jgi:aquaporin Z